MTRYSIEQRKKKYVKRYGCLSSAKNLCDKHKKKYYWILLQKQDNIRQKLLS